jgi:glycosyltransferase involved in cell wall biosynthesis
MSMAHRSSTPVLISAIVPIAGFPNGTNQIESWIRDSSLSHFEVILVIDSEDDKTHNEAHRIGKVLSDLTKVKILISSARNPGGTRNLGLSSVSGDWVVFWDCDDVPIPSQFFEMINQAVHKGSDIAIGAFVIQKGIDRSFKSCDTTPGENVLESIALNPGMWRFAFKSYLAKRINFHEMKMAEDQIYLTSIFETKPNLHIFGGHVYTYWQYESNQLTSNDSALNQLVAALDIFVEKYKYKQCDPMLMVIMRLTLSALKKGRIRVKIAAVSRLLFVSLRHPKTLRSFWRLFRKIVTSK